MRAYRTSSQVYRWGRRDSPICPKCCGEEGTLIHLMWRCPKLFRYWREVTDTISRVYSGHKKSTHTRRKKFWNYLSLSRFFTSQKTDILTGMCRLFISTVYDQGPIGPYSLFIGSNRRRPFSPSNKYCYDTTAIPCQKTNPQILAVPKYSFHEKLDRTG